MPDGIAPINTNLVLGAGQIFFDRDDRDGEYLHLGNCTGLTIEFEDDKVEVINRMTQSLGKYRRVTRERTARVSITGQEFPPENVALVTMGSVQTLAQSTNSVTDEVLATAADSEDYGYYQTDFQGISSLTVTHGATPLVVDVDYIVVDADVGVIQMIPGGAFVAGTQVEIDYTYDTRSLKATAIGDTGTIEGKLLFIGDPAAGPKQTVELWKISIEPEGGIEFIGDGFLEWNLQAEILDQSAVNPTYPFGRVIDMGDYR